ncbi:CBS domain-containing protein [Agaribacterium haliotis]|uniref:CBS domain-containing protein n=1 Tax=Agaribacterium haliotis TaxID=2013869 RepID=UPI000BB53AA6|nr:CBS domain-containing protein [Agaribacterium haliotis]
MHSILVSEYMDHNPHAVNSDSSVRQVVQFLLKEQISGAPVVDDTRRLIGFVSEQDCMAEVLNDAFFCDDSPSVSTVMQNAVATTSPGTSILELAQLMADSTPRNYPVVENGKLVGLISRSRILNAILENGDDCYFRH